MPSPPRKLLREVAGEAEGCVSSTLHQLRDHIPVVTHCSSPRDKRDCSPCSLCCTRVCTHMPVVWEEAGEWSPE